VSKEFWPQNVMRGVDIFLRAWIVFITG